MSLPKRLVPTVSASPAVAPVPSGPHSQLQRAVRARANEVGLRLVWSPSVVLGLPTIALVLSGATFAGLLGLAAAAAFLGALWLISGRVAEHRLHVQTQDALPEVALRLARGLRSGNPIDDALAQVVTEVRAPVGLVMAAQQTRSGRPIVSALEEWLDVADSDAERLLASALMIGLRRGGDVAAAIDLVGEGIRDDLDLAARRRVLLVQATMSAGVLVAMPVVFAVVASVLRGGLVFEGAIGAALVLGGLTLDLLGFVWMRALMRRLR